MRGLVLWADNRSENLGVRALAAGSARLLERALPDIEVLFQGFGEGDSPVRIGSWRRNAWYAANRRSELMEWVRTFDIVLDTRSGDSFADIYGMPRLATQSLMAELVRRSGVPLVMGPQTIGPFLTRRGRWFAGRSLRGASIVMSRDSESSEQAAALGRPVDLQTTDVVFGLDDATATRRRDVIINPSGLLWGSNGHVDSAGYRAVVLDLCRRLLAQGRELTLLAHVIASNRADNDVPALRELADELGAPVETLVPESLGDVRNMLASAEVVIGSRMHACLNALSVGRPAISLAYSRKFAPLLADLGWTYNVDLRSGTGQVDAVLEMLGDPGLPAGVDSVRERARMRLQSAERAISAVVVAAR